MIVDNAYSGLRRVIDISGDGPNNSGLPALAALVTGPDLWTHVAVSLKRVLVGLGLALLAGWSKTPAQAATPDFANCTEANEAGYYNIPASSPVYKKKFDRDGDGIGCDHPDPTKRGTYIHPETAPAPKPAPEPAPAPRITRRPPRAGGASPVGLPPWSRPPGPAVHTPRRSLVPVPGL